MNRLEQTILKNLIYNDEYIRKVIPFIRPEYFSDNTEKIVFKEVYEFINKYKSTPTHEALVINFTEKKNLTESEVSGAIELLKETGVKDLVTINVLDDDEVRQGIKEFSNWPTVPQLYVKGEFIGGTDIMVEMFESGELQTLLKA